MDGDIVTSILLPGILAFIMFSLGLGLTVADFARIVRQPRALLVGVFCHFVLLPVACFVLLKLVGLTGTFAVQDTAVVFNTAVPEPASALLVLCGMVGFLGMRRTRRDHTH